MFLQNAWKLKIIPNVIYFSKIFHSTYSDIYTEKPTDGHGLVVGGYAFTLNIKEPESSVNA